MVGLNSTRVNLNSPSVSLNSAQVSRNITDSTEISSQQLQGFKKPLQTPVSHIDSIIAKIKMIVLPCFMFHTHPSPHNKFNLKLHKHGLLYLNQKHVVTCSRRSCFLFCIKNDTKSSDLQYTCSMKLKHQPAP